MSTTVAWDIHSCESGFRTSAEGFIGELSLKLRRDNVAVMTSTEGLIQELRSEIRVTPEFAKFVTLTKLTAERKSELEELDREAADIETQLETLQHDLSDEGSASKMRELFAAKSASQDRKMEIAVEEKMVETALGSARTDLIQLCNKRVVEFKARVFAQRREALAAAKAKVVALADPALSELFYAHRNHSKIATWNPTGESLAQSIAGELQ